MIRNLLRITSTFHTNTRPSSPAEAHLQKIIWKEWVVSWNQTRVTYIPQRCRQVSSSAGWLVKHCKKISISVRNHFLQVHLRLENLKKHLSWGLPPSFALWPPGIRTTCSQNQQTWWADEKREIKWEEKELSRIRFQISKAIRREFSGLCPRLWTCVCGEDTTQRRGLLLEEARREASHTSWHTHTRT